MSAQQVSSASETPPSDTQVLPSGGSKGNIGEPVSETLPVLFVSNSTPGKTITDIGNVTEVDSGGNPATATGSVLTTVNGTGGKIVQVQGNSNSSIAYVGTLIRQRVKGSEVGPQKVLLTPVKGKDGNVARFILPRSVSSSSAGSTLTVNASGKVCKRYIIPGSTPRIRAPAPYLVGRKGEPGIKSVKPVFDSNGKVIFQSSSAHLLSLLPSGTATTLITDSSKILTSKIPSNVITAVSSSNSIMGHNKVTITTAKPTHHVDNTSNAVISVSPSNTNTNESKTKVQLPADTEVIPITEETAPKPAPKPSPKPAPKEKETESVERAARKRKMDVTTKKSDVVIRQVERLPFASLCDPFSIVQWDNKGLGVIPESNIKVYVNELGMIIINEDKQDLRSDPDDNQQKSLDLNQGDLYCCMECSCYGLKSEFFSGNFCSQTCVERFSHWSGPAAKKEFEVLLEKTKRRSKRLLASLCAEDDKNDDVDGSEKDPSDVIEIDDSMSSNEPEYAGGRYNLKRMKRGSVGSKPNKILTDKNSLSKDVLLKKRRNSDFSELFDQSIEIREVKKVTSPFPWTTYLAETNTKHARVKLFKTPYPTSTNPFKIGYKLEAIDPEHQSLICAASVVQVQGYRIKVHFDGYSSIYDFWINADSPDIFPCGFCAKNGIPLQPPWGFKCENFTWQNYLCSWKSKAAPISCFPYFKNVSTSLNLFRKDMKLEAVDKKNSYLICVATVAAVLDSRILVHFDSWDEVYDYWVDISSPLIHYVGWCEENKLQLTPPNGYKNRKFVWSEYLKESNSSAAPRKAFSLRPPYEFKKGSKLEVVDKRAPHLIRVATIKDIQSYQIKIAFDGFPEHFGYWVDDDSPDIHPINWCLKTGHPLQPPPTREVSLASNCPTPGCIGDGHARNKHEAHSKVEDCPYSLSNIDNDDILPDRLKEAGIKAKTIELDISDESEEEFEHEVPNQWKFLTVREMEVRKAQREMLKHQSMKRLKAGQTEENDDSKENEESIFDKATIHPGLAVVEQLAKKVASSENPFQWGTQKVADFANSILNKPSLSLIDEQVDGEAFLMLTQSDLTDLLGFKLGDALKLYSSIKILRQCQVNKKSDYNPILITPST